jgi:transcription initiation factor TFIID subunit 10
MEQQQQQQPELEDASVQQKTNVSALFETSFKKTTTTNKDGEKDANDDINKADGGEKELPPSMTPEDILGHEGITETDLYRFLEDLDEMAPTIPDQYTNSVLKTVGVSEPDVRVTRLISLAAQKFMQQIADDCFKVQANKLAALPKDEKLRKINQRVVLTTETLGEVLSEYGVSVKKPSLFVGSGEDEEMEAEEVEIQEGEGDGDAK